MMRTMLTTHASLAAAAVVVACRSRRIAVIMSGGGGTPKHTTEYQLFSGASLRFNNLSIAKAA